MHAFVNALERAIGTYLYGCQMHETLFWENVSAEADEPAVFWDYAGIWRAAEKIAYSRTLQTPMSARTRIEHAFEPDAVRQLKLSTPADIPVGGDEFAGQAITAGLVDEFQLFTRPIVVGGGKRALPDNIRAKLELLDKHRFKNGVVHLHCRMATGVSEHPRSSAMSSHRVGEIERLGRSFACWHFHELVLVCALVDTGNGKPAVKSRHLPEAQGTDTARPCWNHWSHQQDVWGPISSTGELGSDHMNRWTLDRRQCAERHVLRQAVRGHRLATKRWLIQWNCRATPIGGYLRRRIVGNDIWQAICRN